MAKKSAKPQVDDVMEAEEQEDTGYYGDDADSSYATGEDESLDDLFSPYKFKGNTWVDRTDKIEALVTNIERRKSTYNGKKTLRVIMHLSNITVLEGDPDAATDPNIKHELAWSIKLGVCMWGHVQEAFRNCGAGSEEEIQGNVVTFQKTDVDFFGRSVPTMLPIAIEGV